jgi:hypothetical protein
MQPGGSKRCAWVMESYSALDILRLLNLKGLRRVEVDIGRVASSMAEMVSKRGSDAECEPGVTDGGAGKSFCCGRQRGESRKADDIEDSLAENWRVLKRTNGDYVIDEAGWHFCDGRGTRPSLTTVWLCPPRVVFLAHHRSNTST